MAAITLTAAAATAARLAHAVGMRTNLGRDATAEEVRQHFIQYGKDLIRSVEREEASTTPVDLT